MLFVHEVHRVKGAAIDDFEDSYRQGYMRALAKDPGARLLWYFNHAHGTSVSFNVVTVTAVDGFEAWQRVADNIHFGDLRAWARDADRMRYGSVAKVLRPVAWSPLQQVDLAAVPVDPGAAHPLTLFAEDTLAPGTGDVAANEAAVGKAFRANGEKASPISQLAAGFRPVPGGGPRREIVLLQKVLDQDRLARLYFEQQPVSGVPWSAGHDPLPFDDDWQTRILRCASWSPLY